MSIFYLMLNSNKQPLPLWISDTEVDPDWITHFTGLDCQSCKLNSEADAVSGMSGAKLTRLTVCLKSGQTKRIIFKSKVPAKHTKTLGLERECLFFSQM